MRTPPLRRPVPDNAPTTSGSGHDKAVGYGAVFAVREFRAMFAAHVLSILGTVFATVALAALVFQRTGSALLTALVFALTNLPYALSGVLLSGIADRHPAREVLVACDVLSAVCVAGMVAARRADRVTAGAAHGRPR